MNVVRSERTQDVSTPTLRIRLCGNDYVLPIANVIEVAAMVETATLVEQAHPALHGVVIRRGQPLVLLDLRCIFGCQQMSIDVNTLFVVVKHGEELVGLIVDEVLGVIYFADDEIRPIGGGSDYIRGVVAYENTLLQWVQTAAILADILPDDE
jgi:purine-binding chemotaxis protein CheW